MTIEQPPDADDTRNLESGPVVSSTSPPLVETATTDATELAPVHKVLARLVEYASGRYVAFPPHTTYALLEQPKFFEVPGAASYAYGLLIWQESRIPLIDLNTLLYADQSARLAGTPRYALVVAFQSVPRGPLEYGAIGLETLPQTISIGDELKCELPSDSWLWPLLALSCFKHEGQAVPILDTTRIFGFFHDPNSNA